MIGRRLPDTVLSEFPLPYDDLREGDIWKCLRPDGTPVLASTWRAGTSPEMVAGNLTGFVWMFMSPGGAGVGTLVCHTVREHDDGTVSIRPGDGSSNSILQSNGYSGDRARSWHGYVEHNEWTAC